MRSMNVRVHIVFCAIPSSIPASTSSPTSSSTSFGFEPSLSPSGGGIDEGEGFDEGAPDEDRDEEGLAVALVLVLASNRGCKLSLTGTAKRSTIRGGGRLNAQILI